MWTILTYDRYQTNHITNVLFMDYHADQTNK